MQFITYDENNNRTYHLIHFGGAVCGRGFHELLITRKDIERMQQFHSDPEKIREAIGEYFLSVICVRQMGTPIIKCPPVDDRGIFEKVMDFLFLKGRE